MPFKFNPFTSTLDEVGAAGGGGDVLGPATSTDNALARWDGVSGETLQDSSVLVSDNGEMTNTLQPAFLAVLENPDDNVTGAGAVYVLGTNTDLTEILDQGNNLNVSGPTTFTAPVTGVYYLYMNVTFSVGSGALLQGEIVTPSGVFRRFSEHPDDSIGSINSINVATVVPMTALDTATFQVEVGGLAGDTADLLSPESTFVGGYLIA